MKKKSISIGYLLFAMVILSTSCKKQDLLQPAPPAQSTELRFSVAALPGTPNAGASVLQW